MSDGGECTRPKRPRIQRNLVLDESDIENELFGDDDSDDDFFLDNLNDDEDEEESDEEDQQLSFSVAVINSPCPISASLEGNENVLSDNINVPSPCSSQEPEAGPPQHTISSSWSTISDLKIIPFNKQNAFFANPGSEPIDFFNYFFEDELLSFICVQTNAQAAKLIQASTTEHSRVKSWKDIMIPELKIFLGLLFHMGTIQLSRLQDYWKTDRLFSIPIFREQMPRNRFLLILRCLHFTSEAQNNDPLFKIRHIIDYFNNKMETCYYPAKELSLDESMVLWRGRLRFKQYIKNKRHRYGIKLYMLTEPDGLVLKFRVYAGRQDSEVSSKGHAERVVMQLLENKLQNGHSVFMNNYYNSVGLAKKMLDNKTYCTGTLRKDLKENPGEISKKNLRKGENVALCKDGVIVGKWKDKRPVMYISTEFESEMMPVTNKRGQTTNKPMPVVKYNEFMSGVDRQDQLLAFYPCERKTLRWYLKLAIHTFQLMFINSYKLYNKYSTQQKMNLYDYRLSVVNKLLPEKISAPVAGPSRRIAVQSGHKISKITEKNSKGILKRKMCRQCSKSKKRKDSIWHCELCENQPGLCFDCFDIFHS